jgi:Uma2 family endonuclease
MARKSEFSIMTEAEYLRFEDKAKVKHEYVHGYVFAMSGATEAHNIICGNIFSFLHGKLDSGPCRAFITEMKIRLEEGKRYYYPDIMVTCEPFDAESVYKSKPVLIMEVLSPSTSMVDRREKMLAYRTISSLKEYVVIHQKQQLIEFHSRASDDDWVYQTLTGDNSLILDSIPNLRLELPFGTIYRGYNPPFPVKENEGEYDSDVTDGYEDVDKY